MDEGERVDFKARLGNLGILVRSYLEKGLITEAECGTYLVRLWRARTMKDLDTIIAELKEIDQGKRPKPLEGMPGTGNRQVSDAVQQCQIATETKNGAVCR